MSMTLKHPTIIQGGMGIAISDWKLAQAVSKLGQLGVVSGTAINNLLVRRLQDGDKDGMVRMALRAFPNQNIIEKIIKDYFIEGGKSPQAPYKRSPLFQLKSPLALLQLTTVASFCEVWLARQGHSHPVGINLLEKVHLPNLAALYGAMLAGVRYVIMGAGIPREIPGVLDCFSTHKKASLKVPVEGSREEALTEFDPSEVMEQTPVENLFRPYFFPIVSSAVLAQSLQKKSTGAVNGFIVEGPLAGGHNAPPRGPMKLNERGEPIYGTRDVVSLEDMKNLGLPFWMAGDYGTPEKLAEVRAQGAEGVQVGTLFAFCTDSGLAPHLRKSTLNKILTTSAPEGGWVFTDPRSSPTGFPFKAVKLADSVSNQEVYESRKRICDLGYLRHFYQKEDGSFAQRCPAEPIQDFVKKGGKIEETEGRKCLCNALFADIGMPQIQFGNQVEKHLLTAGDDLNNVSRILKNKNPGETDYTAEDVLKHLLEEPSLLKNENLPGKSEEAKDASHGSHQNLSAKKNQVEEHTRLSEASMHQNNESSII